MQDIEKIYEEYFETVNKYLFCLTHNQDISEELTQETFYKAVKKIDTFKGECKMSVWLCQIAKNLWYDQCRKNRKEIPAFYATIEEISEGEVYGTKTIKVKGLDINDVNHRGEFYFTVILDHIPDNFKIEFNGTKIAFEELKVGQKVAVYNYGDVLESEPAYLSQVRKIVVLDDTL